MTVKKKSRRTEILVALAIVGAFALGLFGGAWYEARQVKVCVCVVKGPQIN